MRLALARDEVVPLLVVGPPAQSFAEGTRITLTAAETGEKVVVDGDRVIMCGDGRETVFTVKNHPDVFKNEEGGLALEADGLTVRHCNYTCWAHPVRLLDSTPGGAGTGGSLQQPTQRRDLSPSSTPPSPQFEGGNYDFAWRFDAQDDGTFVLFNWRAIRASCRFREHQAESNMAHAAMRNHSCLLHHRYAEDDAVFYLDICDGNAQITGNPRRWAVNVVG